MYINQVVAVVLQVTYQLKILTTAIFSVTILRKQLTWLQWIALAILTLGVGIVQMQSYEQRPTNAHAPVLKPTGEIKSQEQSAVLGFVAVCTACVMSGFAGVYFEKLLKHTTPSIYLRNVQLSIIGIAFGIFAVFFYDGSKVGILCYD